MPERIRKRPKIGDIIEINTPKGLAYAQYTHKHDKPPKYGALLRIFPGFHKTRPTDFSKIVTLDPQFMTFFPLGAACNRGMVKIVANTEVPGVAAKFPVFRTGTPNKEGRVEVWWLWDGEKEWKIGRLKPGMEKYPIRGVWNDALLIKRISEGWNHMNFI